MALVPCPECQKEVSTKAVACPQCAFPFPGKQGVSEISQSTNLSPCQECGFQVSKQARSCPHCGVTLIGEQAHQTTNGNVNEETWLCPHCGKPYTRKVKLEENIQTAYQEPPPLLPPVKELETSETGKELQTSEIVQGWDNGHTELESLLPLRSRAPLWQNPSATNEGSSSRYPRSRNKSMVVGFIILLLVIAAIVFGAFMQLEGINPLEALVFWQM